MQTSKMIDVNHSKIDFRWSNRLDYKENIKTICYKSLPELCIDGM